MLVFRSVKINTLNYRKVKLHSKWHLDHKDWGAKFNHKHKLIFHLLAIVFKACWAERGELRSWALEVGSVFLDKFNQFCPYNWVIRKIMEPKFFPFCILAAWPIGGNSNTINTSSLHFSPQSTIRESCFVHPWIRYIVTWYFLSDLAFLGSKVLICSVNKTANLCFTHLKLWNRMFEMLYFSNVQNKISLQCCEISFPKGIGIT